MLSVVSLMVAITVLAPSPAVHAEPVPAGGTQGAPSVAAWHSVGTKGVAAPLAIDQATCLARARAALTAEGFRDIQVQDAWWAGGKDGAMHASISCVGLGGGSQVDVVVSGSSTAASDVARLRDALRDRLLGRTTASNTCGWRDGMDSAVSGDAGRGITNRSVHYDYAASGGAANAHVLVSSRLDTLSRCLDRQSYAGLYADASVLLAGAGRERAGWVDGMDRSAGDDPGRGLSSRQAHFDYVAGGGDAAPRLIGDRMAALRAVLSAEEYANLYADLSILVARVALGR